MTIFFIVIILFAFLSPTIQKGTIHQVTTEGSLNVQGSVEGSQFIINSKTYYIPVVISHIPTGTYTLQAHNNGFRDQTITVTIEANKTTNATLKFDSVDDNGVPVTPFIEEREDAVNQATDVNSGIAQRAKNNPFTTYLPEVIGSVLLDYDVNADGSVTYVVHALHNNSYVKADYEQRVADFIQSKGYDPKTLNLQWR